MIYSKIISSILCAIVELYTASKILNKHFNLTQLKVIISIIVISSYHLIFYDYTNSIMRIIGVLLIIAICTKIIYQEKMAKIILSSFFSWLILFISEVIVMILTTLLFNINIEIIHTQPHYHFLANLSVYITCILLINIKKFKNNLIKITEKLKIYNKYYLIFLTIFMCLAFSICVYFIYVQVKPIYALIFNLIILIIYAIIIIIIFNEKEKNYEMQKNIDNISENLLEYEKMLDYQRVANHENKNQLLVIKGMLKKNDKDTIEYIDSIVKEKREENEDFYSKTKRIPSGGLQGLIYYKLLSMKDKKIEVNLTIDPKIRKVNLEKYGLEFNKDLCKIIGVILDNAIQAVENLKEKYIEIIMENKEEIEITVSNNYQGIIDFSKFDQMGYTTKGRGHGYGLVLLNRLVEKHSEIHNEKEIIGNIFIQKIKIKK